MGDGEETGLTRIVSSLDEVFTSATSRQMPDRSRNHRRSGNLSWAYFRTSRDHHRTLKVPGTSYDLSGYRTPVSKPDSIFPPQKGFWEVVKKFDRIIGRDRLAAWHLNDSKTALGSRVDRHDHIGKGKIGLAPFCEIMRSGEFSAIPKVLETPKKEDLKEDVREGLR